jgi:hypothetical protein
VNYPNSLTYTGNACGFPTSGAGTVFSQSITTPAYTASPYTGSLSAYNGQQVKIRWTVSTDSGVNGAGWWIDDISVTNFQTPGTCTPGAASVPGETAAGATSITAQSWPNKTTHAWPSEAAATSYTLYRGAKADLPQLLNASTDSCTRYSGGALSTATVTEDPTGTAGGFFWYLVTGSNASGEGTAGNASSGTRIVNTSGSCP